MLPRHTWCYPDPHSVTTTRTHFVMAGMVLPYYSCYVDCHFQKILLVFKINIPVSADIDVLLYKRERYYMPSDTVFDIYLKRISEYMYLYR